MLLNKIHSMASLMMIITTCVIYDSYIFIMQIVVSLTYNSRVINDAPRVVSYAPK
jgi:hypothetical protein